MKKLGIREAVLLAEGHALSILDSTEDCAFWGKDYVDEHVKDWQIMQRARDVVMNRIRKKLIE